MSGSIIAWLGAFEFFFSSLDSTAKPLAFDYRHDRVLVSIIHHGIIFQITYIGSGLYGSRSIMDRAEVVPLAPTILSTVMAVPLLFVAAQLLPQRAALSFVCEVVPIKGFMVYRNKPNNLFWVTDLLQKISGFLKHGFRKLWCMTLAFGTLTRKLLSLFGVIAFQTYIPTHLYNVR